MIARAMVVSASSSWPGWLDKLTSWFKGVFAKMWDALWDMIGDAIVGMVEAVLSVFSAAIDAIPVPDFVQNISICGLLSNAGPTAAWVIGTFKVGECMTVLISAVVFRLLRKLLTLGQW